MKRKISPFKLNVAHLLIYHPIKFQHPGPAMKQEVHDQYQKLIDGWMDGQKAIRNNFPLIYI